MRWGLRKSTLAVIGLLFALVTAGLLLLSHGILQSRFLDLEEDMARDNLRRGMNALALTVEDLNTLTKDWAWWDDTSRFARTGYEEYVESNLPPATFQTQKLSLCLIYNASGGLVWGRYADEDGNLSSAPPEALSFMEPRVLPGGSRFAADGFAGYMVLSDRIFQVACQRILSSNRQGPPAGWLLMGREVSRPFVTRLSETLQLPLTLGREPAPTLSLGEDSILASASIPDLDGRSALNLSVRTRRDLRQTGEEATLGILLSILLTGLMLAGLTMFFLERQVLARVSSLERQVSSAGGPDHAPVSLDGDDELTSLARSIEGMFRERRENEKFLSLLLDSLRVGVILVEVDTRRVVEVNALARELAGRTREEIVGRPCHGLLCPNEAGACPILDGGKEDGDAFKCQLQLSDGSRMDILKSVARLSLKGKDHLLETFVDISELEKAQQALADSEERYRTLFMNTGTAGMLIEADTRIRLANAEFANLMGFASADQAVGRKWTEFFHPDDVPRMLEYHAMRRKGPGLAPRNYETRVVDRRGEVREVFMTVAVIPGTDMSVASITDITDRKKAERELERQAFHDELTGLPNRQLFQDRLRRAMLASSRAGTQVGLLLLDLDDFKHVNDTLGHSAGDKVLRMAAERFAGVLRREDTLARLGGDEFAVVVEGLEEGLDPLTRIAGDLLKAMRRPFRVGGNEFYLGVSVGIAVHPLDADTAERLVQNADLAMYRAKESGKNTFSLYKRNLNDQAARRLTLETDLRRALAEERLTVFFQPKVDMGRGEVVGMEALVRWREPDGSLRPPAAFIDFAESSGLIVPIDLFVLEAACRQAMHWAEAGFADLTLAVNLSAQHFRRDELPLQVAAILERTGLPSHALELEITETALLKNFGAARAAMEHLNGRGVSFALDDFGTGYSSLSYLMSLPLQTIKVDKTFVDRIGETSGRGGALVRTILSMADGLGLSTVAEGVETREQADFLLGVGCRLAQGYHYAPPLPAEEFEKLLRGGPLGGGRS